VRAGGGQVGGGERPGGDADRPGPGGQGRADVERRIPDQHGGLPCEVAPVRARRPGPGLAHQFSPDLVGVTVGADVQVEILGQAERAELHLGQRADVAGQQRLHHRRLLPPDPGPPVAQGGQGLRGARQRPDALPGQVSQAGGMRGHQRVERVHLPPRIGHSGQREHLDRDAPVGPPGHRPGLWHLAAEHLPERDLVQLPAGPAGVEQRVVHIPQHEQSAHPPTVSAGSEGGRGGGWGPVTRAGRCPGSRPPCPGRRTPRRRRNPRSRIGSG
jgi:hypothetical protein